MTSFSEVQGDSFLKTFTSFYISFFDLQNFENRDIVLINKRSQKKPKDSNILISLIYNFIDLFKYIICYINITKVI